MARHARPAAASASACSRWASCPGSSARRRALAYAPLGQVIPSDMPGAFAMGVRRPVGVVGAIAPWNAALILSARSIAAPLVFGNTVVLKPSEESPYVGGLLWGEIFAEAGLPAGVLNIVTHAPGDGGADRRRARREPAVRRINFTGSTATGRRLAEAAGRNLKRVVLELGGQNPLIVLADADLDYAVDAAAFGAFLHQGQICMSARRIIVERPIAEEFTARLAAKTAGLELGDPKEMDTIIGPLINADGARDGEAARRRGRRGGREGARGRRGRRAPASRRRCSPTSRRTRARPARDVRPGGGDRGRRQRRGGRSRARTPRRYGLASGIITSDPERGHRDRATGSRRASSTSTTSRSTTSRRCRSAASRTAGWGRFGGAAAMDEFTELRWVTVQSGSHPFPF